MRRLAAVVAVALLLSGCNALGSTATERPTVTPAPLPGTSTATTTDRGPTCIGPRLAVENPEVQATPPTPVALESENGTVDGRTVVERHVRALSNHSYHLRTDMHELWVMQGGVAFTYESVGYEWTKVRAYAVNGHLYTFVRTEYGSTELIERRYRRSDLSIDDAIPTLTVRRWLAGNVSPFEYTLVDTRIRNGTRVRVLRAVFENGSRTGVANATLYVDRRGIIRTAAVERCRPNESGYSTNTVRSTYSITDIDTARPFRPDAFCRDDWSDANVATLTPTARPTTAAAGELAGQSPEGGATGEAPGTETLSGD